MIRFHRLLAVMLCFPLLAHAEPQCSPELRQTLTSQARQQLASDTQGFADIHFAILGSDDWVGDMLALDLLLGFQPRNLDYQHPDDLAELLLEVSVERVALLLQQGAPGASLFAAGEQAVAKKPRICVITLDACAVAASNLQATAFMMNLPIGDAQRVARRHRLTAGDFLRYVIDHESYHCLDASHWGGMPMGFEDYWGEYWRTRNEMAADVFALGLHIKRHGAITDFVTNLTRLRGLAILDGDPQHFTYEAIQRLHREPLENLLEMSPKALMEFARKTSAELLPDYGAFVRFWADTHEAMAALGSEPVGDENRSPDASTRAIADPARVQALVGLSRRLHKEVLASP